MVIFNIFRIIWKVLLELKVGVVMIFGLVKINFL